MSVTAERSGAAATYLLLVNKERSSGNMLLRASREEAASCIDLFNHKS